MTKFTLYITFAFLISSTVASAQDYYDKTRIVNLLKEKMKDPEGYYNEQKANFERMKELEDQLKAANQKNSELSAEVDNKTRAIDELKLENDRIASSAGRTASRVTNATNSFSVGGANTSNNLNNGVTSPYRVQVGVFTNYNMNGYLQVPKPFYSANVGGRNVMEIGGFNSADEAYAFSQELRKLGISGAFVTKFNGNQRDMSYNYLNSGGSGSYRSASSVPASSYPSTPPSSSYNRYGSAAPSTPANTNYNNNTNTTPSTPRKASSLLIEDDSNAAPANNSTPAEPASKPIELKRSGALVIED